MLDEMPMMLVLINSLLLLKDLIFVFLGSFNKVFFNISSVSEWV